MVYLSGAIVPKGVSKIYDFDYSNYDYFDNSFKFLMF